MIENTLSTLKRSELVKLFKFFNPKTPFSVKWKNEEIIMKISESATEEDIQLAINGIKVSDEINEQQEKLDLEIAKNKTEPQTLAQLRFEARKKAMEPVMVFVNPNDENDISMNRQSVTSYVFSQECGDVAKVVPFGYWCEVPRCIAKNIRDVRYTKYVAGDKFIDRNGNRRLGTYKLAPKYSVQIMEKDEFLRTKTKDK